MIIIQLSGGWNGATPWYKADTLQITCFWKVGCAGLRTVSTIHRARNTANTSFHAECCWRQVLGPYHGGGEGAGGREPWMGIIYSWIQRRGTGTFELFVFCHILELQFEDSCNFQLLWWKVVWISEVNRALIYRGQGERLFHFLDIMI